jgi:hypothetical protein
MLSLLSDTYRGKTQGLRIGAAECDITNGRFTTIKPPEVGGIISINSASGTGSPFVTFDSSQGDVEFDVGTKFLSGVYTDIIYPQTSGGEIDSLATAINRKSTYSMMQYQGLQNFQVNGTSFLGGTNFPASLSTASPIYSNFLDPFNPTIFGWSEGTAFSEASIYNVTVSISATSSNHPVTARLAMTNPANGDLSDFLADTIIPTGTSGNGTISGVVPVIAPFTHISLVFYSPQGATTLNNLNMNVTFNRLN